MSTHTFAGFDETPDLDKTQIGTAQYVTDLADRVRDAAAQPGQWLTPDLEHLDDAELLAQWATVALRQRRFPLAVELTRLAHRAHRIGVRPAGHDAAQAALFGPGRSSVVSVPLVGQTRDEQPRESVSHAPSRCGSMIMENGRPTQCDALIGWASGHVGDATRPPVQAGWYHLDPEITDHEPVVSAH